MHRRKNKRLLVVTSVAAAASFLFLHAVLALDQLYPSETRCSAAYSTPCARNNAQWLAITTAEKLQLLDDNGANFNETFANVTNGLHNYETGFYPFIFDAATGVCLAHGANHSWVNLTIFEIFTNLNMLYADPGAVHERFVDAIAAGGDWISYLWKDKAKSNSKLAYAVKLTVTNGDGTKRQLYLGVGYESEQLPPHTPCSDQLDEWCSHTNVVSLVGVAQLRFEQAASTADFGEAVFGLSFRGGTSYRIPNDFYVFMWRYDGVLTSHAKLHGSFGSNFSDVYADHLGIGTKDEGWQLHEKFKTAADRRSGGWVQYRWRNTPDEAWYMKIAFVVKVNFRGQAHYLGAGYNFERGPLLENPDGGLCSQNFSTPCAYKTTLQLTSHVASHASSSSHDPSSMFRNITEHQEFKAGSFYPFVYRATDATCVAHKYTHFVNRTLAEVFDELDVSSNATTIHEQFRLAAARGGGFVEYEWVVSGEKVKKVSYLFSLHVDGIEYYAGVGYGQKQYPVPRFAETGSKQNKDPIPCSNLYGLNCSRETAQSKLGEAVAALAIAASTDRREGGDEAALNDVLAAISNGTIANPTNGFHVMVFAVDGSSRCARDDGSGCCVANGANESFVGKTWQQLLDVHGINAITGAWLHRNLTAESSAGCGNTTYPWSGEASSDSAALFKRAFACQFRGSSSNATAFYVVSEHFTTKQPRTCGDGCPSNMTCNDPFCTRTPASYMQTDGSPIVAALLAFAAFLAAAVLCLCYLRRRKFEEKIRKNLEEEMEAQANDLRDKLVQIVEVLEDFTVSSYDEYQDKLLVRELRFGIWSWEEDDDPLRTHSSSEVNAGEGFVDFLTGTSREIEHAYQMWRRGKRDQTLTIVTTNAKTYVLDFASFEQRSVRSGHSRRIRRQEVAHENNVIAKLPLLPHDFSTENDRGELLPLYQGQIIQITKTHQDQNWVFGNVLYDPLLHDAKESDPMARHHSTQLAGLMASALLDRPTSGWFPKILTRDAQISVMRTLLDGMGSNNLGGLATPSHWVEVGAGQVVCEVEHDTLEFSKVADFFKHSLSQYRDEVEIARIDRIQNKPLWQSYAVKKQTMKSSMLQHPEHLINNRDPNRVERKWLFHGTTRDAAVNIANQGFNRAFAGRHAVLYGLGVYFAKNSYYSMSYAPRDSEDGLQRMFLCRVAVGDWCQGKEGQPIPDRKPHSNVELFNTTVNDVDKPTIFVAFHDAQAFPEYLVSFRRTQTHRPEDVEKPRDLILQVDS